MGELESSLHLYQPPLYCDEKGRWHVSYAGAVNGCGGRLTWDPAAILSILSFNYPCGDRTLLNQVKRSPWLSKIGQDKKPQLEDIPPHGRLWKEPAEIAESLGNLLYEEAVKACQGRKEIYILLSGGLDSRIVAGILSRLFNEGRLETKPVAITWGRENSRDVFYGRAVADMLGFEWKHINIDSETVVQNIPPAAEILGCLVPPLHLHHMLWFKNVSRDALVLAGSYGDSVGRAEFSSKHLLELDYLRPTNVFGLIRKEALSSAYEGLISDLEALHNRAECVAKYVQCEHELQGHYMRGMIAHVMTVINQYCTVYQMFTDPKVYRYMWLIHPVRRDDSIYAILLEQLEPRLLRLPWARTNKALKGKTEGALATLRADSYNYAEWISSAVYEEFGDYVDPDWFGQTGIFDPDQIRNLTARIAKRGCGSAFYGIRPYDIWVWLAAFRKFSEWLDKLRRSIHLDDKCLVDSQRPKYYLPENRRSKIRRFLSQSTVLVRISSRVRRFILKQRALRKYPPQQPART